MCGIGFALSTAPLALMAFGLAFNVVGAIGISTLRRRIVSGRDAASVSSSAFAVNRVAATLVPLALLDLLVLAFGPRGLSREPVE